MRSSPVAFDLMDERDRIGQLRALDYLEATAHNSPDEARLGQKALLLLIHDVDGNLDQASTEQLLFGMANVADWAFRSLAKLLLADEDTRPVLDRLRQKILAE
jgi:hypothetical protein